MTNKPIEILNNFSKLKTDFKTDTGLDAKDENIGLYINYFNARMNDKAWQELHHLSFELSNQISFLPDQIRLKIAEMIREHDVIKEIRQSLKSKS